MRTGVLLLAVFLAACGDKQGPDTAASAPGDTTPASRAETAESPRPVEATEVGGSRVRAGAMPPDACTLEGYWSFFEAFVREPTLRSEFSDENGRPSLTSFDIAQRDSRWVRSGDATVALDIEERRESDKFMVEATPVELDADDEVVRTLGETARYRFEFKNGCWRFAGTP